MAWFDLGPPFHRTCPFLTSSGPAPEEIPPVNLVVIGTGYVGLVAGACFAEMGFHVTFLDVDAPKIEALRKGEIQIYEPDLGTLVRNGLASGRLQFTTDPAAAMREAQVCFIAVGTPPRKDGSADLTQVLEAARQIGRHLKDYTVIAEKSTVPVGTADRVRDAIKEELDLRGVDIPFDVVSNPEFLKEGSAVQDFMRPDRIVIGSDSERAQEVMGRLYAPFTRNHNRTLTMGIRDAEMTKYAANAMLAARISFINEIASLCEGLGVDVENVRLGIGSDNRIGYSFLYPGCGYGGSCFPKDVKALIQMAREAGVDPHILSAVEKRNNAQRRRLFQKVTARFGPDLRKRTFALWGLSFKPGTDDLREAPSRYLLEELIAAGARVQAYDPVAMEAARREFPADWFAEDRLLLADNQYDALRDSDALLLVTEWKPFRCPDFHRMKSLMKGRTIFDGRNQYDPRMVHKEGFEYQGIGRS